jgi:AcrR family transcriptional regulator
MNAGSTSTGSSERPQGRPADVASGELQDRLLDAAETLFAEHGFDAVPLRRIADESGVTPALVHYYFGSKKKLLYAVIDRAVRQLADGLSAMKTTEEVHIEDLASLLFSMASKHPAMPRLITREVLLSGGETREVFTRDYAPRLGGALPGLIARARAAGRIDPSLDDGAAALMLLSLCIFPFIAQNLAGPVLGIRYDREGLDAYLLQVRSLLKGGMLP